MFPHTKIFPSLLFFPKTPKTPRKKQRSFHMFSTDLLPLSLTSQTVTGTCLQHAQDMLHHFLRAAAAHHGLRRGGVLATTKGELDGRIGTGHQGFDGMIDDGYWWLLMVIDCWIVDGIDGWDGMMG